MRTLYESTKDLTNEVLVMEKLRKVGVLTKYYKLSMAYSLDFAAIIPDPSVGNIVRLVEIKCRSTFYREPYVALLKWRAAVAFLNAGVDSSFVWYFDDGRCLIARTSIILDTGACRFMMTDRTINNRGDKHDCEPVMVATNPREIRV